MLCLLRRLTTERSGSVAIEYGLIIAATALAIIVSVTLIGAEVVEMFDAVASGF
ncbi:MAG: Flp family type IVb pilin [Alphaproteobacteria bacterium]